MRLNDGKIHCWEIFDQGNLQFLSGGGKSLVPVVTCHNLWYIDLWLKIISPLLGQILLIPRKNILTMQREKIRLKFKILNDNCLKKANIGSSTWKKFNESKWTLVAGCEKFSEVVKKVEKVEN